MKALQFFAYSESRVTVLTVLIIKIEFFGKNIISILQVGRKLTTFNTLKNHGNPELFTLEDKQKHTSKLLILTKKLSRTLRHEKYARVLILIFLRVELI